jgi:pilus assembly protein FimV
MAVDNKHRDEQDLERYGVWVKAGPDELDGHDSSSLELMDIEDSDNEELLITEEEEKLLGELEESALPDFGDFDESFDSDLDESDFDDEDFQLPSDDEDFSSGSHHQYEDGESQGLLHKIEEDLNALRQEIRQLKDEITGLRVPSLTQAEPEAVEGGGFFDEEDDETIALTGDELDNILDSADMTEESAEEETETPEQTEPAFVAVDEDISLEDEEEELIDLSGDFEDLDFDTGAGG